MLFAIGTTIVAAKYGGSVFLPGLVAEFGASLAAFVLALRWDHERERQHAQEEAQKLAADRDRQLREQHDRLVIEARRRLEPIRKELGRDKESVDTLAKSLPAATVSPPIAVNPQLLDGAWFANASRLSEILDDYELVGDLAFTYGRIEELRWRLRQRTAILGVNLDIAATIAVMTEPLVDELVDEIGDLLTRITSAIEDPPVRARSGAGQQPVGPRA